MKEIAPGIHLITGTISGRVFVLPGENGLTLIDAGLALAPKRVAAQISAKGYAVTDIARILITHAHLDHVGGLPELARMSGAEVISSRREKPDVEETGVQVSRIVSDGEIIEETPGPLQAILTPGHSPGHTAYWEAERRFLFCGDAVMRFMGMSLPFAAATVDMDEAKQSVSKLAALNPEAVFFSHGPALMRDTAARFSAFAARVAG